jgi:ParB/RepB/Spo0J family partition protein
VEIAERTHRNKVVLAERKAGTESPAQEAAPTAASPQVVEVGRVLEVPTELVKPLEGQPRTYFDDAEFKGLRTSIEDVGQLTTVSAVSLPDGTFRISDGERRWRACAPLGKTLRIEVVPELPSHVDEVERSMVANFNRAEHTHVEKARTFRYLRDHGRTIADIARKVGVTPTTIYNYLLLLEKLAPEVIDLMDPAVQGGTKNLLGMTAAIALTPFYEGHREEQVKLARHIVSRKLKLQQASRLIATRANELGIRTGRGRERKGSDYLQILNRLLERLEVSLEYFKRLSDEEFDGLFSFSPASVHQEALGKAAVAREVLVELEGRLRRVKNPGCKRKAVE